VREISKENRERALPHIREMRRRLRERDWPPPEPSTEAPPVPSAEEPF